MHHGTPYAFFGDQHDQDNRREKEKNEQGNKEEKRNEEEVKI